MTTNNKVTTAKDVSKVTTSAPVAAAQSAVAAKSEKVKKEDATVDAKKEEAVEATAKKAQAKPAAKKETKKAEPKKATKRTTKKKEPVEVIQEVYFEYNGEQILSTSLVERVKEAYKNEGHRISSIKSLRLYINPNERRAYYVINDIAEGKFIQFYFLKY